MIKDFEENLSELIKDTRLQNFCFRVGDYYLDNLVKLQSREYTS
jgi:hypothetical protein